MIPNTLHGDLRFRFIAGIVLNVFFCGVPPVDGVRCNMRSLPVDGKLVLIAARMHCLGNNMCSTGMRRRIRSYKVVLCVRITYEYTVLRISSGL